MAFLRWQRPAVDKLRGVRFGLFWSVRLYKDLNPSLKWDFQAGALMLSGLLPKIRTNFLALDVDSFKFFFWLTVGTINLVVVPTCLHFQIFWALLLILVLKSVMQERGMWKGNPLAIVKSLMAANSNRCNLYYQRKILLMKCLLTRISQRFLWLEFFFLYINTVVLESLPPHHNNNDKFTLVSQITSQKLKRVIIKT